MWEQTAISTGGNSGLCLGTLFYKSMSLNTESQDNEMLTLWDTWGNWDQVKDKESILSNHLCAYDVQNALSGAEETAVSKMLSSWNFHLRWFTLPISSTFQGNNIHLIAGKISHTIFLLCAIT